MTDKQVDLLVAIGRVLLASIDAPHLRALLGKAIGDVRVEAAKQRAEGDRPVNFTEGTTKKGGMNPPPTAYRPPPPQSFTRAPQQAESDRQAAKEERPAFLREAAPDR